MAAYTGAAPDGGRELRLVDPTDGESAGTEVGALHTPALARVPVIAGSDIEQELAGVSGPAHSGDHEAAVVLELHSTEKCFKLP